MKYEEAWIREKEPIINSNNRGHNLIGFQNLINKDQASMDELNNLSVLDISGNTYITDLPPEMGLLHRLWNLNTSGCSLQEPLASMTASKHYKTMDIIGYLELIWRMPSPTPG